MKKLLHLLLCAGLSCYPAGSSEQSGTSSGQAACPHFSWETTLGTAVALDRPASTPLLWQVSGYYNLSRRWAVGAGTGISVYEKALLPLSGSLRFRMTRPRKITPYLNCGAGYSFALASCTNGGMLLNPAIGAEIALRGKLKLLLNAGYEFQELERLKGYSDDHFSVEFRERLNHHSIVLRAGVLF